MVDRRHLDPVQEDPLAQEVAVEPPRSGTLPCASQLGVGQGPRRRSSCCLLLAGSASWSFLPGQVVQVDLIEVGVDGRTTGRPRGSTPDGIGHVANLASLKRGVGRIAEELVEREARPPPSRRRLRSGSVIPTRRQGVGQLDRHPTRRRALRPGLVPYNGLTSLPGPSLTGLWPRATCVEDEGDPGHDGQWAPSRQKEWEARFMSQVGDCADGLGL